jgi:hypothetical protein
MVNLGFLIASYDLMIERAAVTAYAVLNDRTATAYV